MITPHSASGHVEIAKLPGAPHGSVGSAPGDPARISSKSVRNGPEARKAA